MKIAKMPNGKPEIYGPVLQGEGPDTGLPVFFVRLSGCNLYCKWCDSSYTWNYEGNSHEHIYTDTKFKREDYVIEMTEREIADYILELREESGTSIRNIVFSGGEPLLQQDGIVGIMDELSKESSWWACDLETNGTIMLKDELKNKLVSINCSPKLGSSGVAEKHRMKKDVIKSYNDFGVVFYKFVVGMKTYENDMEEIQEWQDYNNVLDSQIYIMPEGIHREQIVQGTKFLEENLKRNWHVTTRLHVLLHGDKRAV
jgi:7-carboxy-7-deazaguanine synthase